MDGDVVAAVVVAHSAAVVGRGVREHVCCVARLLGCGDRGRGERVLLRRRVRGGRAEGRDGGEGGARCAGMRRGRDRREGRGRGDGEGGDVQRERGLAVRVGVLVLVLVRMAWVLSEVGVWVAVEEAGVGLGVLELGDGGGGGVEGGRADGRCSGDCVVLGGLK